MSPKRASSAAGQDAGTFLAALEHPAKPAVLALRELLLAADPRVREGIKWNAPSYSLAGDAGAAGADFATFHLRGASAALLVLHFGAAPRRGSRARERVADPAGLLEWKGPDRAVVSVRDVAEVTGRRDALLAMLRAWVREVAAGPEAPAG